MFKTIRNTLVVGTALILVAAFARVSYLQSLTDPANQIVQDTSVVDHGDIVVTVSASGPIQPALKLPLVFLQTGKVQTVQVTEGQTVLKGQTLATLDTTAQQNALAN